MDDKDLYELRAEDYASSWQSMRTLEWQVAFQLYAGYALLGATYSVVNDKYPGNATYAWLIIGATILLLSSTLYLSVRIQERQHYARTMQNAYIDKLHEMLKAPILEAPPGTTKPKHQRWYAFMVQTIVSVAFAGGLIAFVVLTTWPLQNPGNICR